MAGVVQLTQRRSQRGSARLGSARVRACKAAGARLKRRQVDDDDDDGESRDEGECANRWPHLLAVRRQSRSDWPDRFCRLFLAGQPNQTEPTRRPSPAKGTQLDKSIVVLVEVGS